MKNYYLILNVHPDSTTEEIKTAYRQQAKDLHPDYYGSDSKPFLDLQEAYAVLGDPARRRAYDNLARRSSPNAKIPRSGSAEALIPKQYQPEPLIPEDAPVVLGDLSLTDSFQNFTPSFDELFDRIWKNFNVIKPKVEELKPLTLEIRISPREAFFGGEVTLLVPAKLSCPFCHGQGGIGFFECGQCAGAGSVIGEYPVAVSFPAGITNNYVVQLPLNHFGISNFYLNIVFRVGQN